MRIRGLNPVASALPSCRVVLLLGGVLLASESVALATTMFAASGLTLLASLLLAVKIYRASAIRAAGEAGSAPEPRDGAGRAATSVA